jgi:1-acyl-sn-glycerol-3-phosphate acyltransferase
LLVPVFLLAECALLAVCATVVVVTLVIAPVTPRRRVLRLAAFGCVYLGMEIVVVVVETATWIWLVGTRRSPEWFEEVNFNVLRRALSAVLAGARRLLGFELVVDPKSMMPGPQDTAPLLVLCRHGGLGDSFAVVHLLLSAHQRRVRIVMKAALQWDPALDLVLNRLSTCFLASHSDQNELGAAPIGRLAENLREGDALLLFPEGANWTPGRQERAIRSLRKRGKMRAAWVAEQLSHVLPIRPSGVLSCLSARPDFSVVVVAHTGLDKLVTVGSVWSALPLRVPMVLRSWSYPEDQIPREPDAQMDWLTLEWAVVDEWIDSRQHQVASGAEADGVHQT